MPDRSCDNGHADQEHNGSSGKKEADETQEQFHESYPVVSRLRLIVKCNYTAVASQAFGSNFSQLHVTRLCFATAVSGEVLWVGWPANYSPRRRQRS
jgi:hypothetical protein